MARIINLKFKSIFFITEGNFDQLILSDFCKEMIPFKKDLFYNLKL